MAYIKNNYPNHKLIAVHIRKRDIRGDTSEFLYNLYTTDTIIPKLEYIESVVKDPFVYLIFSNDIQLTEEEFTFLFKERIKSIQYIGMFIAILGLIVALYFRNEKSSLFGGILIIIAAFSWSLCNIIVKKHKPVEMMSFII